MRFHIVGTARYGPKVLSSVLRASGGMTLIGAFLIEGLTEIDA